MIKKYLIEGKEFEVQFSSVNFLSYAFLLDYSRKIMLDDPYKDDEELGAELWSDIKVETCIRGIKKIGY